MHRMLKSWYKSSHTANCARCDIWVTSGLTFGRYARINRSIRWIRWWQGWYWRRELIGGLSGEMPACVHYHAQTALSHVWDPILQSSQIFPTFSTIKSFVCPKYPTAVWKCKKSTKPRKWLADAKWLAIVGFSRHFGSEKASGCGSAPNVA